MWEVRCSLVFWSTSSGAPVAFCNLKPTGSATVVGMLCPRGVSAEPRLYLYWGRVDA